MLKFLHSFHKDRTGAVGGQILVTKLGRLLDSLPIEERVVRYRQFAEEAFRRAGPEKDKNIRAGYISMASGWHALAAEAEKRMAGLDLQRKAHREASSLP